jgi:hypothetical protein
VIATTCCQCIRNMLRNPTLYCGTETASTGCVSWGASSPPSSGVCVAIAAFVGVEHAFALEPNAVRNAADAQMWIIQAVQSAVSGSSQPAKARSLQTPSFHLRVLMSRASRPLPGRSHRRASLTLAVLSR